ncbi:MAG: CHAT domain-containing protein [Acidaminococcales bacterium]|jgi:hypothetical protein|nr:CHAT domain-containing protein [Acidaminococcales bacterium]
MTTAEETRKALLEKKRALYALKLKRAQTMKDALAALGDDSAAAAERSLRLQDADMGVKIALAENEIFDIEETLCEVRRMDKEERRAARLDKTTLLFLAANAIEGVHLSLDKEVRAITASLERAALRNRMEMASRWSVRPSDLIQAINETQPEIVHFSGHGTAAGELVFEGKGGQPQPVKAHAIVKAIVSACPKTRLCFFNACFSEADAKQIVGKLDAAVGMRTEISDEAARTFAAQFYSALGFGKNLAEAIGEARAALAIEGIAEEDTPALYVRDGLKAEEIIMVKRVHPAPPDA